MHKSHLYTNAISSSSPPPSSPPSITRERWHNILYIGYPFNYSQIWSFSIICRSTVLVKPLLSDTRNARWAPRILLNATPSGSSRLYSSMNFGSSSYIKELQLLFAKTLALYLHHSDVVVVCKAGISFCWNKWELFNKKN